MSKAKITRKEGYKCAPNGHKVEVFAFSEIVTGRVAEWALADKAASRMFDNPVEETKVVAPTETKKKRGRPKKKAD